LRTEQITQKTQNCRTPKAKLEEQLERKEGLLTKVNRGVLGDDRRQKGMECLQAAGVKYYLQILHVHQPD